MMAKIYEEAIVIKLSKLVKTNDNGHVTALVNAETLAALEQVAQELVGSDVVVEIESA